VTIVSHHTDEHMKRLEDLRSQFVQLMNEKMDEFTFVNDLARVEIDRQGLLQNSLLEVTRKLGLNSNI